MGGEPLNGEFLAFKLIAFVCKGLGVVQRIFDKLYLIEHFLIIELGQLDEVQRSSDVVCCHKKPW